MGLVFFRRFATNKFLILNFQSVSHPGADFERSSSSSGCQGILELSLPTQISFIEML